MINHLFPIQLMILMATFLIPVSPKASSPPEHQQQEQHHHQLHLLRKRHTPFLPGDYWKGMRPDFGDTETDVKAMVNGTARLKCPISHVADSGVGSF